MRRAFPSLVGTQGCLQCQKEEAPPYLRLESLLGQDMAGVRRGNRPGREALQRLGQGPWPTGRGRDWTQRTELPQLLCCPGGDS